MFTRQDYMDKRCSHEQYYLQFSNENIRLLIEATFTLQKLQASKDPHLNDIPLHKWDKLEPVIKGMVNSKLLREAREGWSLSTSICIAKCTARQLVKEANN